MSLIVGLNTYTSMEQAEAYFADRLGATVWENASAGDREDALITSFNLLERLRYVGSPSENAQSAKWPRINVCDTNGNVIPGDVLPAFLLAAQCEETLALLQLAADPGAAARTSLRRQGVQQDGIAGVTEKYGMRSVIAGLTSEDAYQLLKPYLLRAPLHVWSGL